jgi:hypothetical protein
VRLPQSCAVQVDDGVGGDDEFGCASGGGFSAGVSNGEVTRRKPGDRGFDVLACDYANAQPERYEQFAPAWRSACEREVSNRTQFVWNAYILCCSPGTWQAQSSRLQPDRR